MKDSTIVLLGVLGIGAFFLWKSTQAAGKAVSDIVGAPAAAFQAAETGAAQTVGAIGQAIETAAQQAGQAASAVVSPSTTAGLVGTAAQTLAALNPVTAPLALVQAVTKAVSAPASTSQKTTAPYYGPTIYQQGVAYKPVPASAAQYAGKVLTGQVTPQAQVAYALGVPVSAVSAGVNTAATQKQIATLQVQAMTAMSKGDILTYTRLMAETNKLMATLKK
jgi:hypothetical protein